MPLGTIYKLLWEGVPYQAETANCAFLILAAGVALPSVMLKGLSTSGGYGPDC